MSIIIKGGSDSSHPFGLDVYEDFVYWTDQETANIERIDKYTGGNRTLVASGLNHLMDIRVFHKNRKYVKTPCHDHNGGCSHLCLLAPNNSYTCACPIGILMKVCIRAEFQLKSYWIEWFCIRLMAKLARTSPRTTWSSRTGWTFGRYLWICPT